MTRQTAPMTVAQVAAALSVHPATVRRWIAAGKLPAIVLPGGRYRIPESALTDLTGAA